MQRRESNPLVGGGVSFEKRVRGEIFWKGIFSLLGIWVEIFFSSRKKNE